MGKVLVVDDSDFDRRMIVKALTVNDKNLQIESADSGIVALGFLENFCPDVIVLDIRMPDMDGFDVLCHLKNRDVWRDFPVVMLSGSAEDRDRNRATECGADGYFVKPTSVKAYSEIAQAISSSYLS